MGPTTAGRSRIMKPDEKEPGRRVYEECAQCGSLEIKRVAKNKFKCQHCGCVYQVVVPKVFVQKGANVIFGKNIEIKGGLEIEAGARVEFQGKVEILEDGIHIRE